MHKYLFTLLLLAYCPLLSAANLPISLFPLTHYSQDIDKWLSPEDTQYTKPLLSASYQQQRFKEFYRHLYATDDKALSPWSQTFVATILNKNPGVLAQQQSYFTEFSNLNKQPDQLGYGENFHPYPVTWIDNIAANIDLAQFNLPIKYSANNRAIVVKNTASRLLPTTDPHFFSYELPGQGYPFDNLQASALWVGTPVYIVSQTKDKAWSLVLTPSFLAWVESNTIARTSPGFIKQWQKLTESKLAAVIHTEAPVTDLHQRYQFKAYVGSVFPLLKTMPTYVEIRIPVNDNGNAQLSPALINKAYVAAMPLTFTPENFAKIIKTLQNRPYGWGGLYFYNDCSAETQSLYTPFGIWLPRNSSKQSMAGNVVDLSNEPAEKRLSDLMQNGHPLLTLIYIGGHIVVYLGNYPDPNSQMHHLMAMSYQNIWGLSPQDKSQRAVIGQAVLLPLLLSYPEDPTLGSLANKKFFQVIYLNQWPATKSDMTDIYF